ncbi:MAG TPA: hypothetical protein VMU93_13525 [Caulobacteraceae bacterium]|nr:hypothetical protein [Caulobacteraceae bacterium]
MTTQRNKVHHVWTVAVVARDLGVDEDLIHELTLALESEDGLIWVYDVDNEDGTLAFTDEGIEQVRLLLAEHHRSTRAPD